MPTISEFYGMTIKMYFMAKEHNPPHIHITYGNYSAIIGIDNMNIIEGKLPKRALKIAKEWITINKKELIEMWETQKFKKIEPLI